MGDQRSDAPCEVSSQRYWSLNDIPQDRIRDEREAFAEFARLWSTSVAQRSRPGITPLLLSGGLDSRLLLAELREQGREVVAFTLGDGKSSDPPIAARCAAIDNTPHVVFPINQHNWWDGRELAVWRLDGRQSMRHYHAAVIGEAWHATNRYAPINVAGDAVFGGSWMKSREGSRSTQNLRDLLPRNYRRNPWHTIEDCVALVAADNPEGLDGPSPDAFWLRHRVPQSAVATWEAVGEFETGYPSLSLPLLSFVYGRLTDAQREHGRFYRRFLAWRFPKYFKNIPCQKTGRGLQESISTRLARAAQRASSLVRLRRPKNDVPPGIADYRVLVRHKLDVNNPASGPLLIDEPLQGTAGEFLQEQQAALTDPRTVLGLWTLELYQRQVREMRADLSNSRVEMVPILAAD